MPAWGLIPDSPVFYYGGKALRTRNVRRKSYAARLSTEITITKLVIYKPILNYELNNPMGMVGQKMHNLGAKIVMDAKKQVGVKTGYLRSSIFMQHTSSSYRGQTLKIGSGLSYAYMHHQGTRPHVILPKDGGVLVFRKGAAIIRTEKVMHPGTKANRYLSTPMTRRVSQLRASFR